MNGTFGKNGRRKTEPLDLDITSLLDILVILLVFLLKSYNASDLKLNLVDNLTVPTSEQRKLGNHAAIIQVDKKQQVWMDQKLLGNALTEETNNKIAMILNSKKKELKQTDKKESPVNLVFDKKISYKVIKDIMHTCATSGHTKFKLIVQGNY